MPAALMGRARVFVDSRDAAMTESGDLLLAISDGTMTEDALAGELGALVGGRIDGRQSADQVTIFKSLGMAVEDVVAASLVVNRARAAGIGDTWEMD